MNCNCIDSCECLRPLKKCAPDLPGKTIRKLFLLLDDSMGSNLYDRHMSLIHEYLEVSDTVMMQDIYYVTRTLELLTERMQDFKKYREAILQFLILCRKRPKLVKSSECLTCTDEFTQYFNMFGYILTLIDIDYELQEAILQALLCIFEDRKDVEKSLVKLETCYECLELSYLPEVITELLIISSEKFYPILLKFCNILAMNSKVLCLKMVKTKIIDYIFLRMEPNWKHRDRIVSPCKLYPDSKTILHFTLTCKLFWNLLDGLSNISADTRINIKTPCKDALWSLHYAYRIILKAGKPKKFDRNMLTILIIKYFTLFPRLDLITTDFANDFIKLSVMPEIQIKDAWAKSLCFEWEEQDFYYKKMLLLIICLLITNEDDHVKHFTKYLLKVNKAIPGLLRMITPGFGSDWHPQLYRRLTVLGLHTLELVLPHLLIEFIANNGLLTIVTMMEMFTHNEFEYYLLEGILKLLYFVNDLNSPEIEKEMFQVKAPVVLQALCEYLLKKDTLTHHHQRCIALCFSCLELMCCNETFPFSKSLELCLMFLERALKPTPNDTITINSTTVCFVTFLWEILNNEHQDLLVAFSHKGGIYKMLDLIEKSYYPVQIAGLGLLADMLENVNTVPYFITWRYNTKNGILNFLIRCFKEENLRIRTRHSERGIIKDLEYPLMGETQIFETLRFYKDPNASPACADVYMSCRPKIYAILELLNYRHLEAVSLINEHYGLYDFSKLNTNEKVSIQYISDAKISMELIQNYFALKLGEVWTELKADLENAGIRSITADMELIERLTRRHRYWCLHIKSKQEDELQEEFNVNANKEKKQYRILKDVHLSDSLDALHELAYIARTTDRDFMIKKKNMQRKLIAMLLNFPQIDAHAEVKKHRTFMEASNVTSVFQQQLSIQSNTTVKRTESHMDISKMKQRMKTND